MLVVLWMCKSVVTSWQWRWLALVHYHPLAICVCTFREFPVQYHSRAVCYSFSLRKICEWKYWMWSM